MIGREFANNSSINHQRYRARIYFIIFEITETSGIGFADYSALGP